MLKIDGKTTMTFQDAEDLNENTMLAPLFMNFNQIVQEIMGQDAWE
jgi:hypothetical protein